jgi:hypothetical protein
LNEVMSIALAFLGASVLAVVLVAAFDRTPTRLAPVVNRRRPTRRR